MNIEELAQLGISRIEAPRDFSVVFYRATDAGELIALSLEEVKRNLKALVAAERWTLEQQGMRWRNHVVQTDRESRANYVALVVANQAGLRTDGGTYKFRNGPARLANADIIELTTTVMKRIQWLFDREAAIEVEIDMLQSFEEAEAFRWSFAEPQKEEAVDLKAEQP
jgi:hypothetical protein